MKFDINDFIDKDGFSDTVYEFTEDRIIYLRFCTEMEIGKLPEKYYGARVFFDEQQIGIVSDEKILVTNKPLGIHTLQILNEVGELYRFIELIQDSVRGSNVRTQTQ